MTVKVTVKTAVFNKSISNASTLLAPTWRADRQRKRENRQQVHSLLLLQLCLCDRPVTLSGGGPLTLVRFTELKRIAYSSVAPSGIHWDPGPHQLASE